MNPITFLYKKINLRKNKKRFASFGKNSCIGIPLRINGANRIYIGDNVSIHYLTWLACIPLTGVSGGGKLIIEDGCVIGDFNHIFSTFEIVLRKNVLTANHVYISDNQHCYEDINTPIVKQPIKQLSKVEIGEGSWIGENVCIMGCSIGKGCVIGANSVVTHDIPDYCIAVGAPAKIIKKYDFDTKIWIKV